MGYKLPNGGTFQHAATYAAALAFTAITNASEAVATVVGATLSAGDIVLLSSGWSKLDNKVVRVKAATATAITLEGVDTTDTQIFPAGSGAGSMKKVLTWVQIPQVTDLAFSGGEQNYLDVVFLENDQGKQIPTDKSAASMVLTIADDPAQAFNAVLLAADVGKQVQAARLNLPGNDSLLYGAYTSFSKQPAVSRNNLLTRTVNLALQAEPTRYLTAVV
ncbi:MULTISPECIES: phage tail protein [Pseudomonas]|uniref:phage tail protein n=1 Tax=Pseudomonas TaxID=286 RepID=UPI0005A6018F|nr:MULTISPECIES: phage tail protein [Pseudomonas]AZD93022.1 putative phage protein [Pseudomonas chlororaphis subsp. aureofaciens]KAB0532814.1 phage tail protein [Pseudomonas chlororaphis subsp. aureofaciens]TSD25998.1 phage tail protein [Pseudomonas sp. ATCC 13985]WDG57820.1 phage tail protein [Pseudomonas chlororaphis]WDG64033.1 phage tail protein [Pseudomonas chlororaphis]